MGIVAKRAFLFRNRYPVEGTFLNTLGEELAWRGYFTTQVWALRNKRAETGFDWYGFGKTGETKFTMVNFASNESLFFPDPNTLYFTFFLDKKSNKKIKANPNAPPDLPMLAHKFQYYWLTAISDIVIFSLLGVSLQSGNSPDVTVLDVAHTAGAVFFACRSIVEYF